jgi:HPt (histidine-containing phosphotransfer) domain-containing protein
MMAPDAQRLFRQAVVAAVTGWPLGRNDALALLARLSDLLSGPARDALCAELAALDRTQDFQTFWSGLERVRASLERMCEPGPEVQSLLPLRERSPEAKRTAGEGDSSGADTISWQPPALPGTLLSDFFAEVSEHLDAAAHLVLGLTAAGDPGVQELYRHLHTVKGNSGMVGLTPLKDVTHRMEDVVKGMRDGTLTFSDPIRQVLADGVELAQGILEAARRGTGARLPVQTFLAHAEGIIAQPELRASPDPCGPLSPNGATAEKGTRLTAQGGAQRNPVVAIAEPVACRLQSLCTKRRRVAALQSGAEGPHSKAFGPTLFPLPPRAGGRCGASAAAASRRGRTCRRSRRAGRDW